MRLDHDLRMVEWRALIFKRCKRPDWASLLGLYLQMRELEHMLERLDAGRELL